MAGGVGSRFWPISRLDKPKQFLDFTTDGTSFLRMAYDRMKAIVPDDNILVVSLSRYEEQVREQLPELKEENLLLEMYDKLDRDQKNRLFGYLEALAAKK